VAAEKLEKKSKGKKVQGEKRAKQWGEIKKGPGNNPQPIKTPE